MKAIHILLVEDNEGDILLTREALEETKLNLKLSVVSDGKEAINFLNKQGAFTGAAMPDLVLLDINLPKINGHEVLQYIKGNEDLKHIPVMILTTSSFVRDIDLCRKNDAHSFFTKPLDIDAFLSALSTIHIFPGSSNYPDTLPVAP